MAKATLHVSLIKGLMRTKSTSDGKEMRGLTFMALITSWGGEIYTQPVSIQLRRRRGANVSSYVHAGLGVVDFQVSDDVVHSHVLQALRPKVGRGQHLFHAQLVLKIGQLGRFEGLLRQNDTKMRTTISGPASDSCDTVAVVPPQPGR